MTEYRFLYRKPDRMKPVMNMNLQEEKQMFTTKKKLYVNG